MSPIKATLHNLGIALGVPAFDRLGLLDRHPDTMLFAQMKRMTGEALPPDERGRHVLFMTLKGTWKSHLAWEYTLASALQMRGARCSFLLCDQFFPKCDVKIHNNPGRSRCWACHAYSRAFARYLQMPALWLGQYISDDERHSLERRALQTPYEQLAAVRHNDIDIERTIRPSLHRFFRRGSLDGSPRSQRVHREFILAGLLAATVLPRILDQQKPHTVITVNGNFFAENILYQLCRARGIDIYTYERGKIKDTLNIVCNQISVDWENDYAWQTVRDRDLTAAERERIEQYVLDRKRGQKTVLHYHPNPEEDETLIRREIGYAPGRRHFVLFPNIVWDTAVQFKDIAFENMFEWIRKTIEFFERHPEARLVIRLHPAEVKISSDVTMEKAADYINSVFDRLPDNVSVIPPESDISSYKLIDLADAVIVYTSTIGLESAMERRPTIVCGQTHFSNMGFTIDISEKEQYYRALERLLEGDAFDLDWDAAWKYAYVFFFLCMLPVPHVSEQKIGMVDGVSFRSWAELAPGRKEDLDLICDAMLRGAQILPRPPDNRPQATAEATSKKPRVTVDTPP